jgi:hypothetical protein
MYTVRVSPQREKGGWALGILTIYFQLQKEGNTNEEQNGYVVFFMKYPQIRW